MLFVRHSFLNAVVCVSFRFLYRYLFIQFYKFVLDQHPLREFRLVVDLVDLVDVVVVGVEVVERRSSSSPMSFF